MKQTISRVAITAALTAGMAAPALADVDVFVDVDKTKIITVTETLSKTVVVDFSFTVIRDLARAAEAIALANQTVSNNVVDRQVEGLVGASDDNQQVIRAATIDGVNPGSVSDNQGVTGVNQDVGVGTNQGNIWSVAVSDNPPTAQEIEQGLFTDAQAEVDQVTTLNLVDLSDGEPDEELGIPDDVLITANIEFSINRNIGLTAVNQNAGNNNNQINAVALAAGLFDSGSSLFDGATVALAEAALGQETTVNTVREGNNVGLTAKLANMEASVIGNTGITQVNSDVGNMGNQGNVVAVGAAVLAPQL